MKKSMLLLVLGFRLGSLLHLLQLSVCKLTESLPLGAAVHECVSEEALIHLKSYKYSSVDKSLISKYILQYYVRRSNPPPINANANRL